MLLVFVLSACQAAANPPGGAPLTATRSASAPPSATPQAAPSKSPALAPSEVVHFTAASPTLPPTVTPAVTLPARASLVPTPVCESNLRFIEDLTIPDGTIVNAGQLLDKQWRVENSGSCNWDERFRLQRISGPGLGAPDEQALYPARAGAQAVIRMLLQAPVEPGAYRSAWQAVDPQGNLFGDPIFVDFIIN